MANPRTAGKRSFQSEQQMILPTMEVYLATQVSVPAPASVRRISRTRTAGEASAATVLIWERIE